MLWHNLPLWLGGKSVCNALTQPTPLAWRKVSLQCFDTTYPFGLEGGQFAMLWHNLPFWLGGKSVCNALTQPTLLAWRKVSMQCFDTTYPFGLVEGQFAMLWHNLPFWLGGRSVCNALTQAAGGQALYTCSVYRPLWSTLTLVFKCIWGVWQSRQTAVWKWKVKLLIISSPSASSS